MLLDADEAAKYVKLAPTTLRRWAWEGKVPSVKLGRRLLFRRESLEEFIKANERPAITGLEPVAR